MLVDLEECGFIKRVVPIDEAIQSLLSYYQIRDPYLHFYFHFVEPQWANIQNGDFQRHPQRALSTGTFRQWLGPHLNDFAVTIRWPSPKRLDSALFHFEPEHSSAAEALPTSEHKLIC